jgi:hypothetical protein
MGVFSIAITLLLNLLVFASQSARKEDSQGTAQRTLLATCQRFIREYESTAAGSVTLDSTAGQNSLLLSFSTSLDSNGQPQEQPGTGLALHQAYLIYSRNVGSSTLHRTRLALTPSTEPIALLVPALQSAVASQPGPSILSGISKFSVLNFEDDTPTTTPARRLKFLFQVSAGSGNFVELKVPVEILGP